MTKLDLLKKQQREIQEQIRLLQADSRRFTDVDPAKLSKEEKLKRVCELPELSNELYDLLKKEGFRTGSSEYTNIKPADYDWCVSLPPHVFDGYALGAQSNYWIADGFVSLYAHKSGTYLNILCFSCYTLMQAWFMTTQYMQTLTELEIYADNYTETTGMPLKDLFNTKWKRVMVFRALKDILWPEKQLAVSIPKEEALKRHQCMLCGREAVNFTNKGMREQYQETGVCERCEPELQNSNTKLTVEYTR